jgi:uncharacterized ferredoxin-like protein
VPVVKGQQAEDEAVVQAAKLMLASVRTAPKASGMDDILTALVLGEEKDAIAARMEEQSLKEEGLRRSRDARNVRDSVAVLLIGARTGRGVKVNCGACGCVNCHELEKAEKKDGKDFRGPGCVFKAIDLGIALGSAVKTASILNIDNRIMYTIGAAARQLQLVPEADVIIGISISASGKNIFYDRESTYYKTKGIENKEYYEQHFESLLTQQTH